MTEISMQNLASRHVKAEESARLGIETGWYIHKVSGTFVSGPHANDADAQKKILELNPVVIAPKRKA
ncbi:MAG: hypothetical protein NTZ72_06070 [Afipia sp.]|nr:hypothetical protein [Afipia sp.]